jgi:Zn-dependent protease with chaperone function
VEGSRLKITHPHWTRRCRRAEKTKKKFIKLAEKTGRAGGIFKGFFFGQHFWLGLFVSGSVFGLVCLTVSWLLAHFIKTVFCFRQQPSF